MVIWRVGLSEFRRSGEKQPLNLEVTQLRTYHVPPLIDDRPSQYLSPNQKITTIAQELADWYCFVRLAPRT